MSAGQSTSVLNYINKNGKARNKIIFDDCVKFSDFDTIDPPWELTDECDGRVFVAFMQHVRKACFDDGTPYFKDIVVIPVDIKDANNHKSREYYVFGISSPEGFTKSRATP